LSILCSAVKIPTAILGAENDHIFPADELKKLGEIMSAKTEVSDLGYFVHLLQEKMLDNPTVFPHSRQ